MGLKEKRIESGLNQHEAADLFNLKYRTYQNYENGTTTPTMETAAMFARHFSCTIGELFDLEEGGQDALPEDETELLGLYREMSEKKRATLLDVARAFCEKK